MTLKTLWDSRVINLNRLHGLHVDHEEVSQASPIAGATVDENAMIDLGDGETGSRRRFLADDCKTFPSVGARIELKEFVGLKESMFFLAFPFDEIFFSRLVDLLDLAAEKEEFVIV